jgi:hypothetical protein
MVDCAKEEKKEKEPKGFKRGGRVRHHASGGISQESLKKLGRGLAKAEMYKTGRGR